jgi:hypothetical protein
MNFFYLFKLVLTWFCVQDVKIIVYSVIRLCIYASINDNELILQNTSWMPLPCLRSTIFYIDLLLKSLEILCAKGKYPNQNKKDHLTINLLSFLQICTFYYQFWRQHGYLYALAFLLIKELFYPIQMFNNLICILLPFNFHWEIYTII